MKRLDHHPNWITVDAYRIVSPVQNKEHDVITNAIDRVWSYSRCCLQRSVMNKPKQFYSIYIRFQLVWSGGRSTDNTAPFKWVPNEKQLPPPPRTKIWSSKQTLQWLWSITGRQSGARTCGGQGTRMTADPVFAYYPFFFFIFRHISCHRHRIHSINRRPRLSAVKCRPRKSAA